MGEGKTDINKGNTGTAKKSGLNPKQEAAARRITGQSLIIACPGSGKTTTLLARIKNIIDSGVDPQGILMMTFSRAAAQEMAARYRKMAGKDAGVTFATIHSFCLSVLKIYAGQDPSGIIGEGERRNILYGLVENEKGINDRMEFVNSLSLDISNMVNSGKTPKEAKASCCTDRRLFMRLCEGYCQGKAAEGKIDYDDMLTECLALMRARPDITETLRRRFPYVQVDEFQDTNLVQSEIIFLLAGKDGNLAVVGDDDQCIYGFRAASPDIMLSFGKRYPKAKAFLLPSNYRSKDEVIAPSAKLIAKNLTRFPKEFKGVRGPGGHSEAVRYASRESEADGLAQWAKGLIGNGESPDSMAVLYRTNRQADRIAEAFMAAGAPFSSNERISSRYGHWLFHDILSFHKASLGQGGPRLLLRCMNRPNRYFPAEFAACGLDRKAMLAANRTRQAEEWQKRKASTEILSFLDGMAKLAAAPGPAEGIPILLKDLGYIKYVSEYALYTNEDFQELKSMLESYGKEAKEAGITSWDSWERFAHAKEEALKAAQEKKDGEPAVTLSTMHRSKGLEWKHVAIADCVDGSAPCRKPGEAVDMEEERRLFYVAMTRARDTLLLASYGTPGKASPFIAEAGLHVKAAGDAQAGSLSGRISGLGRT